MNVSSEDIKDMLEEESSLGLTFATDLFIGREPATPNNCVTIFDTLGGGPQLTMGDDNDDYYNPSIQIRVRNNSYITGWNLANDILISLHGRADETYNETLYTLITCTSGPALLDWDDNNRARFIINFYLQRR